MDELQKAEFKGLIGNGIRFDCPMKNRTTLRVGGAAEVLWEVSEKKVLRKGLSYLSQEKIPYAALGRGSNLLIPGNGIKGVMIHLTGAFAEIQKAAGDTPCFAGAGVHMADLLNWCRMEGLSGLEFMAGIPASVGGAVAMNAGAFEEEIKDKIASVQVVNKKGREINIQRSEMRFSYRRLHLETGSMVTGVTLCLSQDTPDAILKRTRRYLKIRNTRQPQGLPSAGSIFKNPPGDFAGRLIDQAGLKGKAVGDAMISPQHANWIVNTGSATAEDILALMERVRSEVKRMSGILLEPEIQIFDSSGLLRTDSVSEPN